ncbi:MAG: hypothetical protein GY755_09665 [Chloroflexi bacterium]|nr:hypothetical protein [Chloroflexota bacterium]
MNVKNTSPLEQIRELLKKKQGILQTSDLAALDIPRTYLSILQDKGEIERVSRGLYISTNIFEDELFSFQSRYGNTIFSHETALYLHDLSDRAPLFYSVSVPVGYNTASLRKSSHKVFYVRHELFDLGITKLSSPHGNKIKVTGPERTIVDILRSRKKLDTQIVNHAFKEYMTRADKNLNTLHAYAEKFRVHNIIRQYIEILG